QRERQFRHRRPVLRAGRRGQGGDGTRFPRQIYVGVFCLYQLSGRRSDCVERNGRWVGQVGREVERDRSYLYYSRSEAGYSAGGEAICGGVWTKLRGADGGR